MSKASDVWEQADRFVLDNDEFLVVSHLHPDGDAIGSTLAVGFILKALGKRYVMVNESPVPQKFRFLPGVEDILSPEEVQAREKPFRRAIAVDAADADRMGITWNLLGSDADILNIDHHPTNDRFGTVNVIDSDAAATAEILCLWADRLQVTWDRDLASCLYTGLLTDTGGFRYSNTTPKVMALASRLLRCGVDASGIADRALETMTREQIALVRRALDSLSFSEDGRIGWMWLKREDFQETGADEEELDGIVNYARNVVGVDVGILFRETEEGTVKASFRSREMVDVGKLAQSFGGGGHARAAGCSLSESGEKVERAVLEQVTRALQGGGS
ncbi:DHH family phosphoesterase [Paludifilum halophilum]|uniref:DHH family phosphoesterase n=1 Tax=Paludifilum halophilum TaxID=1642702 RepID=A0A235BB07_9BACL|nr:bifunctional oligoribonuclease/PAP phosphatase NrnA [Paludifilum halophilum]OYD09484.1 DHH family phosphoesterase [Paludifilum halophilum]